MTDSTAVHAGLICRELSLDFDGGTAGLFGVSLEVRPGSAYGLMGSNGAGKTTIVNICLGYLRPQAGDVFVGGIRVLSDRIGAQSKLAYVPEVACVYPNLSAIRNMQFFDSLACSPRDKGTYLRVLDSLRFPTRLVDAPASTYSKGMRQKVVIAMGLLKGADVFLLDEPTSGLDPRSRQELAAILRELKSDGKAILLTSHDMQSIDAIADRVGLLECGHLVSEREQKDLVIS
jgi:ABC-2 type transport system ATP-binding protein